MALGWWSVWPGGHQSGWFETFARQAGGAEGSGGDWFHSYFVLASFDTGPFGILIIVSQRRSILCINWFSTESQFSPGLEGKQIMCSGSRINIWRNCLVSIAYWSMTISGIHRCNYKGERKKQKEEKQRKESAKSCDGIVNVNKYSFTHLWSCLQYSRESSAENIQCGFSFR